MRPRVFLGYFLIMQWDEDESHSKLVQWQPSETHRLRGGPSPRCIGEAMHESARAVHCCLAAVYSFGVCPAHDAAMRSALAFARVSMQERGCTFQLHAMLPEADMASREAAMFTRWMGKDMGALMRTAPMCMLGLDSIDYPDRRILDDETDGIMDGRWRIIAVDKSNRIARLQKWTDDKGKAPVEVDVAFLCEDITQVVMRPGPIVTATLEHLKTAAQWRVSSIGYVWPTWYVDDD